MTGMTPAPMHPWPEDSLPGILEQNGLWVYAVSPVTLFPGGDSVTVECTAKGPETVGDSRADIGKLIGRDRQRFLDGLARAVRETMCRQAEDAIEAAQAAGWELCDHPRITMDGTMNYDRATGLTTPCAECRVTLRFRAPVVVPGT